MTTKNWLIGLSFVLLFASGHIVGQTATEAQIVDYCEVVTLPNDYDRKILSIEAILIPGEHSLSLFGVDCLHLGYDRVTEAQLPKKWIAMPNGSALSRILRQHMSARVKLIGTFDSSSGPYGPDGARFQFSISQIVSVSKDTSS